ncbi:DUF6844 domain-containing protein [Aliivibrio finisterrensis]|uniref:DUF6844 domain-containing protein n=1 Tax=Aliivibrio finisterrensis TaxID=511998 RepID=A0A6N6RWN5_9GAMM|nr:hypothetical protein [Aliivibrio finisterrensis]KAB2826177.1 hypothetical protein F8B77_02910 [Aliivibrio finisterrensis]
MISNKNLLAALLAGSFTVPNVLAQDVVTQIEQSTQTAEQVNIVEEDPADKIDEQLTHYVLQKVNATAKANKSHLIRFYSGAANISITKSNPDWANYRAIALNEAIAKAREDYLKTLNRDFTQETIRDFFTQRGIPAPTAEDFKSENKFDQLMTKAIALIDGAMMAKLEEMGIDAAEFQNAPPEKKQTLMRQYFGTTSISKAYGDLSGMFVIKTFENYRSDGIGSVGVVMALSAKRRDQVVDMIESNGEVMPDKEKMNPKNANLATVFASYPAPYLNKGVKLMYDAQGYPMLVAFGQSGVVHTSDRDERDIEREAAEMFAEDDAWGAMASAYNLNGDFAKKATVAKKTDKERVTKLVGPGNVRTAESAVRHSAISIMDQSSSMTAELKGMTGVSIENKWRQKHPATGHEMVGVVLVWHPVKVKQTQIIQSGLSANEIDAKQETSEPAKAGTTDSFESEDHFDLSDF